MAASGDQAEQPAGSTPRFRDAMAILWRPRGLAVGMLIGQAFALIIALPPGRSGDPLVYFGLASLLVQWTLLGSLTLAYALREPLSQYPLRISIWALPAILVLVAGGVGWAAAAWMGLGSQHAVFGVYVPRFMGIALVSGVVGTALLDALLRLQEQRIRAERAEHDALRARVRPHFLFNTLNTAIGLLQKAPLEAERVLLSLSDLFRASLANKQEWDISEEIAITEAYLEIEKARLDGRLRVEWRGQVQAGIQVPVLLLQSLVENAVQHGIEPLREGGMIMIEFETLPTSLRIRVSNPVVTEPVEGHARRGHRIGLGSAEQRLARMRPKPGRLDIERDGDRFVATVQVFAGLQPTTR